MLLYVGMQLLQRSWDVLAMRTAHELDVADEQAAVAALVASNAQGGHQGKPIPQQANIPPYSSCKLLLADDDGKSQQPVPDGLHRGLGLDNDVHADDDECCITEQQQMVALKPLQQDATTETAAAGSWGDLYRTPVVQLLSIAGRVQVQLAAQITVLQARLEEHNQQAAAVAKASA
jgi:hypothetical protein